MNGSLVPPDDCRRARASISVRLDGELSELGQARLAAHLRACPACAAYALEIAAVATRMRQAPLERPGRPIEIRRRRGIGASAAAAVAVAAAAAVAVGTIQRGPSQQGATVQADQLVIRHIQAHDRLVAKLASLNTPTPESQVGRAQPV